MFNPKLYLWAPTLDRFSILLLKNASPNWETRSYRLLVTALTPGYVKKYLKRFENEKDKKCHFSIFRPPNTNFNWYVVKKQ